MRQGDPVEAALADLGYVLPQKKPSTAPFAGSRRSGQLVFIGGHGPLKDGRFVTGRFGRDLDVAKGREAAALALVNSLATLKTEVGELSDVSGFVRIFGMLSATPESMEHSEVMNAASELLVVVFGLRGRHTRSAVGMSSLPLGIALELELVAEVR